MSDLRDFTPSQNDGAPRFVDSPSVINEPIRENVMIVDDGGLGNYHINNEAEEQGTGRSKLFAGLAVAVVVGIGAAYGISQYMKDQPVVADKNLPEPSAPSKTAAMTPPAPVAAQEVAPSATTPAPTAAAPIAPDVVKPAPVTKQASISNAPKVMPAPKSASTTASNMPAMTPAPVEQAAPQAPAPVENQASNVPEPVSPTPPASVQAGNPPLNQQSASPDEALPPPAAAQPAPAPSVPPDQAQPQ
ncbi:MAG: hypothetical protein JO256_07660 [Alphaproteobacteria bacterium]|nr:hypothetical protein [Alphaproteobacteria bacterium]